MKAATTSVDQTMRDVIDTLIYMVSIGTQDAKQRTLVVIMWARQECGKGWWDATLDGLEAKCK